MHDKNGKLLAVGDRVKVDCVISNTSSTDDYCNITLLTVEPMYPGNDKSCITLNAKQVEKVE